MGKAYKQNRKTYESLVNNPDYEDVAFDPISGGMKAQHKNHNFDHRTGDYERHVRDAGYQAGHAVILEAEPGNVFQKRYTEGTWDGLPFEVAGRETATVNNIKRGLEHCADKPNCQIAVLNFPRGGFSLDKFEQALRRYKGLEKLNDGQFRKFKKIICVQDGQIIHETDM
jgi:hypothetical protein